MKMLSNIIGKSISFIRNEGFFSGIGMIARGLFSFIKMSFIFRRGDILFVASGVSGASTTHRVFHIAEELRTQNFKVSIIHQSSPLLQRQVNRFSIFIFHHATQTNKLDKFVKKLNQTKKVLIFDTDDLNFDKKIFQQTEAYQHLNALEKKQYTDGLGNFLLKNKSVKFVTTTTNFLANRLQTYGKHTFKVVNKLSQSDLKRAKLARQKNNKEFGKITIGYFSGSKSHDRDFATITDVLLVILEENEKVQLYLMGALKLDQRFDKFKTRIKHKSFVARKNYFQEVARCDITIAPLEIGDAFCESKSELKFFESASVKVPVVAAGTQVFREVIRNGVDGFVANSEKEWYEKLSILIQNKALREKIGKKAYQTALKKYTTNNQDNLEYYNFLRNILNGVESVEISKELSDEKKDTAVIIANWNGAEYLQRCLKSLENQTDQNFTVILVDNGSQDNSVQLVKNDFAWVSIICLKENMGFAHPNNVGIQLAFLNSHIKYIITLNNDTEADEDYIKTMREVIEKSEKGQALEISSEEKVDEIKEIENRDIDKGIFHKTTGAIQPKLKNFYQKTKIDTTGVLTAFEFSAVNRGHGEEDKGQFEKTEIVFGPSASASLYTRTALELVDLSQGEYFDQDYFAYYEDVDLAWRMHLVGFQTIYTPQALVFHVHSATGINYSAFKAFHIHRNHYFNILKNAPFFTLLKISLFMPFRYLLLIASVFKGEGASAQMVAKKTTSKVGLNSKSKDINYITTHKKQKEAGVVKVVFQAWWSVLIFLPKMLKKRKLIQKNKKISNQEIKEIFQKHKVSVRDCIFK
jgi:GT2 family glycosyltransferase/glycosyltransferase involved in cell wall biosynthesis